jgi:hypothetical protein
MAGVILRKGFFGFLHIHYGDDDVYAFKYSRHK